MRLLSHMILAFVAIGLQRGLDALLSVGNGRLDLVMIAASFTAASFPKASGPLAALLIGLAYDLSGAGPIGTYAVALGLGGLAASASVPSRWGKLLAAILAGVIVACLAAWLVGALRAVLIDEQIRDRLSFGGMLTTMMLTGLMALALSAPLWKFRRVFAVESPRL